MERRNQAGILFNFFATKEETIDAYQIKQLMYLHETDTNRYSLSNAAGIKE